MWIAVLAVLAGAASAPAAELTPGEAWQLIRHQRPGVKDPDGWAADLIDVLRSEKIPATRENVCAAIAVIDQESNFVANPVVPGLGKLAEASLRAKLGGVPFLSGMALDWLDRNPKGEKSYLQRIREARTERDLDLTYRALVNDFSTASNLSLVVQSGLLNRVIEERNNISTVGSMQVSVRFALDEARRQRYLPMTLSDDYAVRDALYTRRGGMLYGIKQLLGYDSGYGQKLFRFADYNAGRFSSRNAAFQHAISSLSGQNLARDGDLLLYDKAGKPKSTVSGTEKALQALNDKMALGLSKAQIRDDLLTEKTADFGTTATYIAVKNLYLRKFGKPAPYAELPQIDLSSVKLSHKMTTASYAASVARRYGTCMAAK